MNSGSNVPYFVHFPTLLDNYTFLNIKQECRICMLSLMTFIPSELWLKTVIYLHRFQLTQQQITIMFTVL